MVVIASTKNIPLGALVRVEGEQEDAGIVGDNGLTYLSGLDATQDQHINVTWGDDTTQHCSFKLPAQTETQRTQTTWYKKIAVNCH
ncbi:FimD/PapC C-terminal domain-containing protein [Obesumbacterium proteus]|nr:FimD/PapC C-terminal domain-containing protein [Obesumbacterium proteus]